MTFLCRPHSSLGSGVGAPLSRAARALRSFAIIALFGQLTFSVQAQITNKNWGTITSPVFGSSETVSGGMYSAAELFAGPNKFGSYYLGVLPNGRKVTPAGTSIQIGMNPLGMALTPDGNFLITTNDDERESNFLSYQSTANLGGYSISVINTASMSVVSQINTSGKFFVGLQVTGTGPYTVWASGGGDNSIKLFNVSTTGQITVGSPASITITPIQSNRTGFVSNYTPGAALNTKDGNGNLPPAPSGLSRTATQQITFPAGSALSPDGKYLYVACNTDNSIAVIDTAKLTVVRQEPAGYFPYSVSVSSDGQTVAVSNWGITQYRFKNPTYDSSGNLIALGTTGQNTPDGFYVPVTSTTGSVPSTSSVSVLSAPGGVGANLTLLNAKYFGHPLDSLKNVGDTHPSATAVVHGAADVMYVTKSNDDAIGILSLAGSKSKKYPDFDLSPVSVGGVAPKVHGAYPNALAVSPDNTRLYVAEAGISSVAVLDVTNPTSPALLGRIPTGWYPAAVTVSADGRYLYIANAKGIGEDINPNINTLTGTPRPSGLTSDPSTDSNYIFGSVQQVDLTTLMLDNTTVLANNYSLNGGTLDTSVVPAGGPASKRIKHVIFILHENKTFDSMLGNLSSHFGNFAGTTFNNRDGSPYTNGQYTGVSVNTQALASAFATAVNYYSDSEESDAGHQFAASGTASDYTEKTLLVKSGRGLLVNKNFEPEDYPEAGYIFNNAARHKVSFKDYGALVRIEGTDTGTSTPTTLNDPPSGQAGLPQLQPDNFHVTNPLVNIGDTTSAVSGLGQSYFLSLPILSILGTNNASGEPRLDVNYPGYNFNISDQRRAKEFMADFDRMVLNGTLPTFIYLYQPNDHTGSVQAPNANQFTNTSLEEVADADVALGMVVQHIMTSPIYFQYDSNVGSAIFVTWDDAQSSLDHIHPHRTPLLLISPFAKPGYLASRHYSTASVVKTEELLMGLPPNNLGDLLATDLRDMFQPNYNGITTSQIQFAPKVQYQPSKEGIRIWKLASALDSSAPDRDSRRLGALARLSAKADELFNQAKKDDSLDTPAYKKQQEKLYEEATRIVNTGAPRDSDD